MNTKGKLTFTGILTIFLILYGAFFAYQFINAKIARRDVPKQVKERIGIHRNADFTEEEAEDIIYNILSKRKDIIFGEAEDDSIKVTINHETTTLSYYFEFGLKTNYIFFTKVERVQIEDSMKTYR